MSREDEQMSCYELELATKAGDWGEKYSLAFALNALVIFGKKWNIQKKQPLAFRNPNLQVLEHYTSI